MHYAAAPAALKKYDYQPLAPDYYNYAHCLAVVEDVVAVEALEPWCDTNCYFANIAIQHNHSIVGKLLAAAETCRFVANFQMVFYFAGAEVGDYFVDGRLVHPEILIVRFAMGATRLYALGLVAVVLAIPVVAVVFVAAAAVGSIALVQFQGDGTAAHFAGFAAQGGGSVIAIAVAVAVSLNVQILVFVDLEVFPDDVTVAASAAPAADGLVMFPLVFETGQEKTKSHLKYATWATLSRLVRFHSLYL